MKITKTELKKIIKEEIEQLYELAPEERERLKNRGFLERVRDFMKMAKALDQGKIPRGRLTNLPLSSKEVDALQKSIDTMKKFRSGSS